MEGREKFKGGKNSETKKRRVKEEEVDINTGMWREEKKVLIVAQHLHLLRSLKQTPPPNLPGMLPSPSLICKQRYHHHADDDDSSTRRSV